MKRFIGEPVPWCLFAFHNIFLCMFSKTQKWQWNEYFLYKLPQVLQFANTTGICSKVSGESTFSHWLENIQNRAEVQSINKKW